MDELASMASQSFCYVTTTGRRSGRAHRIEIWFAWQTDRAIYLLAGGGYRADWVANLRADPRVEVAIGESRFTGVARVVGDAEEEQLARRLLAGKYQGWRDGAEMSEWAKSALPIAIDLD